MVSRFLTAKGRDCSMSILLQRGWSGLTVDRGVPFFWSAVKYDGYGTYLDGIKQGRIYQRCDFCSARSVVLRRLGACQRAGEGTRRTHANINWEMRAFAFAFLSFRFRCKLVEVSTPERVELVRRSADSCNFLASRICF